MKKEMATHSSILAWRVLRTEEQGGCSPWGRKESEMTERLTQHSARTPDSVYKPPTCLTDSVVLRVVLLPTCPTDSVVLRVVLLMYVVLRVN